MSFSPLKLAEKKWFVPTVIFILLIISLSSLTNSNENKDTATTEDQLKKICMAISGADEATVMLTYENYDSYSLFGNDDSNKKIAGVAVICEGGENPDIQLRIYETMRALFDLPSTRITVSDEYRGIYQQN